MENSEFDIKKRMMAKRLNKENYEFLKGLYWDLIVRFTRERKIKAVEFLQNSWKEVEELFLES
jgi:hypothetical protein